MKRLFFVLVSGLLVLGACSAKQEKWSSVSFDIFVYHAGELEVKSKIWMRGSGNDIRMETTEMKEDTEKRIIVITLGSKDLMYVYYPEENIAMRMKLVSQGDSLGRDPATSPAPPHPKAKSARHCNTNNYVVETAIRKIFPEFGCYSGYRIWLFFFQDFGVAPFILISDSIGLNS